MLCVSILAAEMDILQWVRKQARKKNKFCQLHFWAVKQLAVRPSRVVVGGGWGTVLPVEALAGSELSTEIGCVEAPTVQT